MMTVTPVVDVGLGNSDHVVDLVVQGAELLAPTGSELAAPHRPLADGDEVELRGWTLQVIATPGHTPEYLAYLLKDGSRPVRLSSGGPQDLAAAGAQLEVGA